MSQEIGRFHSALVVNRDHLEGALVNSSKDAIHSDVHMFVQQAKPGGDVFRSRHGEGWIGTMQAATMFRRMQEPW